MAQTLPGPDERPLFAPDVAARLGISVASLLRMVREGRFPHGIKPLPQARPTWSEADLAAWRHLAGRLYAEPEPAPKKKRNGRPPEEN